MQFTSRLLAHRHGIGFRQIDGYVDCSSRIYHQRWKANAALGAQLEETEAWARAGGPPKAAKRQVSQGKLLIRDRISGLLDQGTPFLELALLAGKGMDYGDIPAASLVAGIGEVSGRLCLLAGHDATVKGGTIYPITLKKTLRYQEIAAAFRLPCIHLVDSGGAFLPLQSQIFLPGGRTFYNEAMLGANGIPQLAVVCGNCTAGGAYAPTMCDDVVMVDKVGTLFLGGPPLVRAATGEVVSAEALGGATLHTSQSGAADYFAKDETEGLNAARDIVATLSEDVGRPFRVMDDRPPLYSAIELGGIAGNPQPGAEFPFQFLARVVDASEFFELRGKYGDALVCGFARIGGRLVGVIMGTGGGMEYKSAQKATQLLQMCDQRRHPILFVQRSIEPPSSDPDTLRSTGTLLAAIANVSVPKITLNAGNCLGHDLLLQCGPGLQPWLSLGWPNALSGETVESSVDAFTAAAHCALDLLIAPSETPKVLRRIMRLLPSSLCQSTASDSLPVNTRM